MQTELLPARCRTLLLFVIACMSLRGAAAEAKPPFPGEKSMFHSYARYDFSYEGRSCIVVTPKTVAEGRPWIWRARFFGHEPQTDLALLERGFHLVYIDVAGLFGAPRAVAIWDGFYDYLTRTHGLAPKAVLEGMSRGGLIVYNWAAQNPDKVCCIYADAPVCDFKSWPAGRGAGKGDAASWKQCLEAYGVTEPEALAATCNPIDNLAPLARAGVPLLHVVGDADDVVPVAENTAVVERRYQALGGSIQVIHKPGVGHHPHSLQDPAPIVEFILAHAPVVASAPADDGFPEPVRERIEWCDIWITNANTDNLPRVLLIGDSITRGYFSGVEQALDGKANCARLTTSRCICDPVFFEELALVLRQYRFQVIHFNNGLHGWGYTEAQYRRAFGKFLQALRDQSEGARLIWATTTPVRKRATPHELDETTERVRQRNRIAQEFVAAANLPVDDLFTLGLDHPEYYGDDGVHYNAAGRAAQAQQVAQGILSALGPDQRATDLRASQVGYPVLSPKLAIALARDPLPETFEVVALDSGRPVFQGTARVAKGMKWGQFDHVAELDFSSLCEPGRFRLRLGGAVSLPIVVDDAAFRPLPDVLLEFLRQQRCGFNPWLEAACHQGDGRTAYGPLSAGTALDARGGWHDAADLLKYLLTSSNATAQMLLAWEICRAAPGESPARLWGDRCDALGRPGTDGRPDLLDEARWGLEWMLKLHPTPGVLYHQVADDRDHCGWRLPQDEHADYGWGKGGPRVVYAADGRPQGLGRYRSESTGLANLAGRYAAAMALAFQVWQDDPNEAAFARRCLTAGQEVYQLGRNHEGVQQGNSYGAPYRYAETTWADDMEWGAAELFRATGARRYLEEAQRYARLAGSESWMGRAEAGHYQFYPFFNAGHFRLHGLVDAEFQRLLEGWYREGIERCRAAGERNPFGIGVPLIWCSNNLVVALVTQCLLYERMTGDGRYRAFAARHRDWLLGRNPWGMTQFMGVGLVAPASVHLMTTRLTGRPLRGGLVDGPVCERIFKSLKGVTVSQPDPLAAFQDPRAVYHDDWQDYSTNEPTMDGTASAVLMWAALQAPSPVVRDTGHGARVASDEW